VNDDGDRVKSIFKEGRRLKNNVIE